MKNNKSNFKIIGIKNVFNIMQHFPNLSVQRSDQCNAEKNNFLNTFYYQLNSTMIFVADRTILKTRSFNKTSVPWWNKPYEIAVRNKKYAFNCMMRTRDSQDILIYKCSLAKAKKIVNNAQSTNWQNYCPLISSNIKLNQIWSIIKRFNEQTNLTYISSIKLNDISSASDIDEVNTLACHFQSTNSKQNYSSTSKNSFSCSINYIAKVTRKWNSTTLFRLKD